MGRVLDEGFVCKCWVYVCPVSEFSHSLMCFSTDEMFFSKSFSHTHVNLTRDSRDRPQRRRTDISQGLRAPACNVFDRSNLNEPMTEADLCLKRAGIPLRSGRRPR